MLRIFAGSYPSTRGEFIIRASDKNESEDKKDGVSDGFGKHDKPELMR